MANDLMSALSGASASASAGAASAARSRTQDMSDQFLTLLVAQMKNQDPLNPMDNSQVTSQMAQINTVSGINDLNEALSAINGQIDTSQQLQASALIGRSVLIPGNEISVGEEGAATPFGMELASPASQVKLRITDSIGTVVHESTYSDQAPGIQSFSWDGRNAAGAVVGPGNYRVSVEATGTDGDPISVKPLSMGYVGGVVSGDNGPQLDLGPKGLVTLDSIRQII